MHRHTLDNHTIADDGTIHDENGEVVKASPTPISSSEHPAVMGELITLIEEALSVIGEEAELEKNKVGVSVGRDQFVRCTYHLDTRRTVAGETVVAEYGFEIGHVEREFDYHSGEDSEEYIDDRAGTIVEAAKAVALARMEWRLDDALMRSLSPEADADLGILTHE